MDRLKIIPAKHSKKWASLFGIYFVAIFAVSLLCQLIIQTHLTFMLLIGLVAISLVFSLVICFGGFLGGMLFFGISTLGTILGLLYMLYISIFNAASGWNDIISLVGFSVFFSFSAAAGIITEGVYYILSRQKHQNKI